MTLFTEKKIQTQMEYEVLNQLAHSNLNREITPKITEIFETKFHHQIPTIAPFLPTLFISENSSQSILVDAIFETADKLNIKLITNLDYQDSLGFTDIYYHSIYCSNNLAEEKLNKSLKLAEDKNVFIEIKEIDLASQNLLKKISSIYKDKPQNLFFVLHGKKETSHHYDLFKLQSVLFLDSPKTKKHKP